MSSVNQFISKQLTPLTATIANGATTSDAVNLYGCTAIGIGFPAAMTGATVTFKGSLDDGSTFLDIYDIDGVQVSYTFVASTGLPLDVKTFAPYDQIKVVSASSEGAERLITIKPFSI